MADAAASAEKLRSFTNRMKQSGDAVAAADSSGGGRGGAARGIGGGGSRKQAQAKSRWGR